MFDTFGSHLFRGKPLVQKDMGVVHLKPLSLGC